MIEKWKKIEGYEDYEVSNFGRIKSYKQDKNGKITLGNKDKKVDHKYEDSENEVEIKEVDINDIFDLLFNGAAASPEDEEDEHNCAECPGRHICSNRK